MKSECPARRPSCRRRRDVPVQEHHPERGQFEDHTTLVAAVKAAGLVETLEGKGPFTVFRATNAASASCRRARRHAGEARDKASDQRSSPNQRGGGKLGPPDLTDGKKLRPSRAKP